MPAAAPEGPVRLPRANLSLQATHAVLRYTALVQEANCIKKEYKTIRAQVSSSDVVIASLAERTRAALSPLLTFAVAAAVISSIV